MSQACAVSSPLCGVSETRCYANYRSLPEPTGFGSTERGPFD